MSAIDANGRLIHAAGLDRLLGLSIVQVPGLDPALFYDRRPIYMVLGQDSTVTPHDDWEHDAMVLLVKARANVGVPVANKSIRTLEITAPAPGGRPRAARPRSR